MKYIYLTFLLVMISCNTIAQSLDDYKYVLVPNRFSWLSEADKYQLNSLTTFLFNKYGFDAIQQGESLPLDMNNNKCNGLTADVVKVDAFLNTKLKIVLTNCRGKILFVSEEGVSSKKDYKWAYSEALREAFYSVEAVNYKYRGSDISESLEKNENQEITTTPNEGNSLSQDLINKGDLSELEGNEYKSQDGSYLLRIQQQALVFYEEGKVIGSLTPQKENINYFIKTEEFLGTGYFQDEVFIIEREIKGVQGIIKMIFVKQ